MGLEIDSVGVGDWQYSQLLIHLQVVESESAYGFSSWI